MFNKPNYERKTLFREVSDIGGWFDHKTLAEVKAQIDELIVQHGEDARFWYNNDYYNGISFSLSEAGRPETDEEYQRRIAAEERNYQRQLRHAENELNRFRKEQGQ